MSDSTQRFSSRVENYIKYRPSYPPGVLDTLAAQCGLTPAAVVADIGSGTGLLSELFLRNGNRVYGVEPNREMREAGERLLRNYPNFSSVDGTAEATTLPAHSVDFVTAGQAFHWFDAVRAHAEFARILRAEGWVMLIWNDRQTDASPFMAAFEELVQRYSVDYAEVSHQRPGFDDDLVCGFFGPQGCQLASYPNPQEVDFAGLRGRLLSSSYTPEPGHPNYQPMLAALRTLFDQYQVDGKIPFTYTTKLFFGRLSFR